MNLERICFGCFRDKEPGSTCPYCGFNENDEQPYLALPLGTLLNGRYMLGKVLGIGGFGITYLGFDLVLEITVAIKEYMPSSIATRDTDRYNVTLTGQVEEDYQYGMARFLDEAKILAKLKNTPHIVSVQNYFKENNTAYFVMEYVEGMSLKAYLADQGNKIPYIQAVTILRPIMEALIRVHALNLLHRDISPDNIYITSQGESMLLDFGAARFALGDGKSVSVILKHGYAPEEQYSSHGNQGPWTDVYAMGATMYRCITGTLPPDSMERMRGDTLKPPSEFGVRMPKNMEQAILKAMAVKTEDRFPNMESFLHALTGMNSTQEQVAVGISEPTSAAPASDFEQTVYGGSNSYKPKPNRFSLLIAYSKANPVIAGVLAGGVLLVLALCIILPIALSGGRKTTSTGGGGGGNSPVVNDPGETPEAATEPSTQFVSTAEMETRDLGILNASIDIPSDYVVSADGFSFVNQDRGCAITTSFVWNVVVPIYSLSDVEKNQEAIISSVMTEFEVTEYTILESGSVNIGGQDAYQIYFEGTDNNGVSMELIYLSIQGNSAFGCYSLLGAYPKGDETCKKEVNEILQTFQNHGTPETTYGMWYSENLGIKIIIDNSVAAGSVWETEVPLANDVAQVLAIYPTEAAQKAGLDNVDSPDAGAVEVGYASEYGYHTPEELLDAHAGSIAAAGGTAGERYSAVTGGAEWLCQNYTIGSYNISSGAAVIEDNCFYVNAMYNDANQEAVTTLCNQVMASVRPW